MENVTRLARWRDRTPGARLADVRHDARPVPDGAKRRRSIRSIATRNESRRVRQGGSCRRPGRLTPPPGTILSEKEVVLAGFQDWIRERLPVAGLIEAPAKGTVAERNAALAG